MVYDTCILSIPTKVLSEETCEWEVPIKDGTSNTNMVSWNANVSSCSIINSTNPEWVDAHLLESHTLEHESNIHSMEIPNVPCLHVSAKYTNPIHESNPCHSNARTDKEKTDLTSKNTTLNVPKHILENGSAYTHVLEINDSRNAEANDIGTGTFVNE